MVGLLSGYLDRKVYFLPRLGPIPRENPCVLVNGWAAEGYFGGVSLIEPFLYWLSGWLYFHRSYCFEQNLQALVVYGP